MSLARCPQCGRALNTSECFACGYVTPKKQNPFGESEATKSSTKRDASQNSNPFGTPTQPTPTPLIQKPAAPKPAAPKPAAPKPITGVHQPFVEASIPKGPKAMPVGRAIQREQGLDVHEEKTLQIDKHRAQAVSRERVSDEATALVTRPRAPEEITRDKGGEQQSVPTNAFSAFVRSPWIFAAIPTLAFLFFFSLSAFLFFRGSDDVLNAINASDDGARDTAKRLAAIKKPSPREELMLGHAYAQLGKPKDALLAYRRAFKRSASDERAIDYTLAALDNPTNLSTPVREALGALRDDSLNERLVELCESEKTNVRHNALNVLLLRGVGGEAARGLRVKVALLDLNSALPSCAPYKEAGTVLRTYGKSDSMAELKSISSKAKKCLATDLDDIKRALSKQISK